MADGFVKISDIKILPDSFLYILEQSARNLFRHVHENDYYVNGVLYCGVCKSPRSKLVFCNNKEFLVEIDCQCKLAERQKASDLEVERAVRLMEEQQKPAMFTFSDRLKDCTFENWALDGNEYDDASLLLKSQLETYVSKFFGIRTNRKNGLYLYGMLGVGKSFASACIVNALGRKGVTCMMTNFNRLLNTSWAKDNRQAVLDELNDYDLVVIDDLGTEYDSKFMQSMIFEILDSRYRSGLPLVVTSNLTLSDLENVGSDILQRAYSRLMEMCFPLEVKGFNRRKLKSDEENLAFGKMLNGM